MSVVGLTFGTAANAIRPSAANAASVATSATIRASGRTRSYQAKPAASATARIANAAELPAHAIASAARRADQRDARPPGVSAPPAPPRIRAVSVAKYAAAREHLGGGAVGDHGPVGRAASRARANAATNSGSWVATSTAASSPRQQLRRAPPCARGPCRASARRGRPTAAAVERARRARSRARAAGARRPTGRADGGPRSARVQPDARASAAAEASCVDALVDEVVVRVLQQQRDPAGAADAARGSAASRPAAWRSSVDLPAPLRPISATRSPGAEPQRDVAQDRRPASELVPDAVELERRRRPPWPVRRRLRATVLAPGGSSAAVRRAGRARAARRARA